MSNNDASNSVRVIQSGLDLVKTVNLTWSIKGFDKIETNDELIEDQKLTFEIDGDEKVPKTIWKFCLKRFVTYHAFGVQVHDKSKNLVLSCCLPTTKKDEGKVPSTKIIYKIYACIRKKDGQVWENESKVETCPSKSGEEAAIAIAILQFDSSLPNLRLIAGSLNIEITIRLYHSNQLEELLNFGIDLRRKIERKAKAQFLELLSSGNGSDIVLISKEGQRFPAHQAILRARSEVLDKMFENEWKESKDGEVQLDDMSSAAVKFLLHFIYAAEVLPYAVWNPNQIQNQRKTDTEVQVLEEKNVNMKDAKQPKRPRIDAASSSSPGPSAPIPIPIPPSVTVEDVLNIAKKYGFDELLDDADAKIYKYCNEANACHFYSLCSTYSLKSKDFTKNFIKLRPALLDQFFQ